MCLSCICLLAIHTLICVTFSLPPGVRGWLRLLFAALPGLFCLPFFKRYSSCDCGCFRAKYVLNDLFNNFEVCKPVSVVYYYTHVFKISTST